MLDGALRSQIDTLVASVDALPVADEAVLAIAATVKPGTIHVVGTRAGLLRFSAYLLAHATGAPSKEREQLFTTQSAEHSWPLRTTVVEKVPLDWNALDSPPRRGGAALIAAAMAALAVSNVLLWSVGLYVTVLWVGARLLSSW